MQSVKDREVALGRNRNRFDARTGYTQGFRDALDKAQTLADGALTVQEIVDKLTRYADEYLEAWVDDAWQAMDRVERRLEDAGEARRQLRP
jgi:hypothetical protein